MPTLQSIGVHPRLCQRLTDQHRQQYPAQSQQQQQQNHQQQQPRHTEQATPVVHAALDNSHSKQHSPTGIHEDHTIHLPYHNGTDHDMDVRRGHHQLATVSDKENAPSFVPPQQQQQQQQTFAPTTKTPIQTPTLLERHQERMHGTTTANTTTTSTNTESVSSVLQRLPPSTPTPQALLSRTPQALLQLLTSTTPSNTRNTTATNSSSAKSPKMTLAQCDELRHQVACAMIRQTKVGQRNVWIHNHNNTDTSSHHHSSRESMVEVEDQHNHPPSITTTNNNNNLKPLILGGTTSIWKSLQVQANGGHHSTDPLRNPSPSFTSLFPTMTTAITATTTGCQELNDLLLLTPTSLEQGEAVSSTTITTTTSLSNRISLLGHVLQLSGPSASGKTLLALQLALELVLLHDGGRDSDSGGGNSHPPPLLPLLVPIPPFQVVYFASRAGHSIMGLAQRLDQLVRERCRHFPRHHHHHHHNPAANPNFDIVAACLDDIAFQPVTSGHQLLQELARIEDRLWQDQQESQLQSQQTEYPQALDAEDNNRTTANTPPPPRRLGMIVVDSMYQMAMVGHGGNHQHQPQQNGDSSSSMVVLQVGHVLKRLARQYSISVVVTNGVVVDRQKHNNNNNNNNPMSTTAGNISNRNTTAAATSTTTMYKPALGGAWHHVAVDVHLSLEPLLPSTVQRLFSSSAILNKSRINGGNGGTTTKVVCAMLKEHLNDFILGENIDDNNNNIVGVEEQQPPQGHGGMLSNTHPQHPFHYDHRLSSSSSPPRKIYLSLSTRGLQSLVLPSRIRSKGTSAAMPTDHNHYNNNHHQRHSQHPSHSARRDHEGAVFRTPPHKRSRPSQQYHRVDGGNSTHGNYSGHY